MAESFFMSQPSPDEIEERKKGYPSWLEIDLDAVSFNLEEVRRHVRGAEVLPCVKANAYGHGLVPIVAHLMRKGVKRVLVAKLWEALQLRDAGLSCDIVSMDPLFTETQYDIIVRQDITHTIFNKTVAKSLNDAAQRQKKKTGAFIKVDTGLGRVGVKHNEAADLLEYVSSLPWVEVEGIYSTFTEDRDFDKVQLERMTMLDAELRRRNIDPGTRSMASSDAVLHFPEAYLDAVRPGIILYGIYPEEEGVGLKLRQALCFMARIEHIKWIDSGESLTYSRRFVAPKRMKVGTVHAGYFDGYPRGLTNRGLARIGDLFKPVLGTVSVNHHIVDLDETDAQVGDVVELVGRQGENTIISLTRRAGIMTYLFCVNLNPLTPRIYYEGGRPTALSEPKLVEK